MNKQNSADEKLNIGLAGEFRVASELLRRGLHASVTFGNTKGTDILVLAKDSRFVRVEVKTSKNGRNFVTGYYPKYTEVHSSDPHVWVFFLPSAENQPQGDRFFIANHEEVGKLQLIMNDGKKTAKGEGVDNITVTLLQKEIGDSMDRWDLITRMCE